MIDAEHQSCAPDGCGRPKLTLSDALPTEGSGYLLHYEHDSVSSRGWTSIDARTIIARYEDEWLEDIDSWHRELCTRAYALTRWWGLMPGSRLLLWATTVPFTLKPILYAKAVATLFDVEHAQSVWVVGAPAELRAYLRDWAAQRPGIEVDGIPAGQLPVRHRAGGWRALLKQAALILRYVAFRGGRKVEPARLLVHSLILNPDLLESIGDHFFGFMLDKTPGLNQPQTAWLYNDIAPDRTRAGAGLERIKRTGYFISDTFRIADLAGALRDAISIHLSLKPLPARLPAIHIGGTPIPSFARHFHSSLAAGVFPLMELVYYRQFIRVLRQSGAETVIYPYEEKPLERAMLMAAQDSGTAPKTIGFAHAAYSKGHMYLRRREAGEPLRPSRVAVTGMAAARFFNTLGVPNGELVCIGSPRHHAVPQSACGPREANRRPTALLLIGHGFELRIFAALIERSPDLFENFDVLIRRYPYGWIAEQDAAEARMRNAGFRYLTDNSDLLAQIDKADVVLFESTSAAMEAVFRGKVVVQVNLSDAIRTNQFLGMDGQNPIQYCSTAAELRDALTRMARLTHNEYQELAFRQRSFVKDLYSEISLPALQSMLS